MKSNQFVGVENTNRTIRSTMPMQAWAFAAVCLFLQGAVVHALPVARIRNLKPMVQIKAVGGNAYVMAHDRNTLRFGDFVKTMAGGKADLLFANGTQLALRENTQIEIVAPETESKPLVIRVFGALSEVFVRPRGNTQIRTAAAVAAARGTQYLVRLPSEDTATVTVTEGSVDFYNAKGTVVVETNQQSNARVGGAPSAPVATDVTGLVTWTADILSVPVEFEKPLVAGGAAGVATALAERQALVGAQPTNGVARRALGEALAESGRPSEALEQLEQAQKLAVDPAEQSAVLVAMALAYQERGDAPAAVAALRQAQQLSPESRDIQMRLALALLSAQDYGAARSALPAQSATASENSDPQAIAGLISLHQGDPAAAEGQLQQAVLSDPNNAQAYVLLALTQLTLNRLTDSEMAARHAAQLQPSSAQAQGILSTVLFFNGKTDEAARSGRSAVQADPESPFALLAEGRIALARLRTDDARDAFSQAQALAPNLPVIPSELGGVYLRLDMLPKAEKAYRRAIELSPGYADAHNGLGLTLQRRGDATGAEAEFRRALELDARNASARGNLAALFLEQGKLAEAQAELAAASSAAPERGILYVRLAEINLLNNDLFGAQQNARRAVSLLPDSAVAHYQLGRVYLEQERTAQAEQQFRQAVALDPQFTRARYALGVTQDIVQQGRDRTRVGPSSAPSSFGTAANAIDIQNLQSPGASERIKAAIADPSVIREATRAYGDTQVDGGIGSENANDLSISHIQETAARRGVLSVSGEYHRDQGELPNNNTASKRFGLVYGQKSASSPSSLFFLGQYESIDDGINADGDPTFANATRQLRKPSFILGGNLQRDEKSRTRALIQYSAPDVTTTGILGGGTNDRRLRSLNGEIRHDVQLSEKNTLNLGVFGGTRNRDTITSSTFPFPISLTDMNDARLYGAYVRDEMQVNSRFRATAEVRVQKLTQTPTIIVPGPVVIPLPITNRTSVLPMVLLEYQLSPMTGLRLRARKLAGTFQDFQLLAPSDPFFTTSDSLPHLNASIGRGNSLELQVDHTFRNSGLLRTGLIFQRLTDALEPAVGGGGNSVARASVAGIRTGYEGVLNDDTTFFINLGFNRVRDRDTSQQIAESPNFVGEAGLQYLNRKGYFLQPTFMYSSSRFTVASGLPSRRQGGFGLFNVRIGKRAGVRSEVFFEVLNAFDKSYELFQLDRSGRQYRVGGMRRF